MAALQIDSKCSRTGVYAPLLNRHAPCPQTQYRALKPLLASRYFVLSAFCFQLFAFVFALFFALFL
jgi:hypothetical protein